MRGLLWEFLNKMKNTCVYCQVFAKDSGNIEAESVVSLEIPSGTVIAYSILELEIKKNGHFGEFIPYRLQRYTSRHTRLFKPTCDRYDVVFISRYMPTTRHYRRH